MSKATMRNRKTRRRRQEAATRSHHRRKVIIAAGILLSLLTAAGIAAQWSGLFSSTRVVEQRARAAHRWSGSVLDSVARGAIIYYDASGEATGQYAITIFRGYPDKVRVEIDRGRSAEVFGFDQTSAWKGGVPNLKEEDARDIRAMVRICPERLFVTRGGGSAYREAGRRIEDSPPVASGGGPTPVVFDQVEMADTLGPAAGASRAGDRRSVYYYVNQATSLVETARWLEPDDPRQDPDDEGAVLTDIRVDFGGWREVSGVTWPFEITHSSGGRVDYRIVLNEVRMNQGLTDAVFKKQ